MEVQNLSSLWIPDRSLLLTRISGDVHISDIEIWEQSLFVALEQINNGNVFKIFVDLFGFKAINIEAHKRFREIVPHTLSNYGWRVGYLDLFEEAKGLTLSSNRGIRCIGAAHVHQDAAKIEKYQSMFGHSTEQYFTDSRKGRNWIEQLAIPHAIENRSR